MAHVRPGRGPDGEQHALAFVVAGAVGVGLTEVAGGDRPVDGADDLAQQDLVGVAGEDIAAADAAFGSHQASAFECEQDLLEIGLGQPGAVGDLAHRRRRTAVAVQRQGQQGPARIVASGRHLHGDDPRARAAP